MVHDFPFQQQSSSSSSWILQVDVVSFNAAISACELRQCQPEVDDEAADGMW